MDMLNKLLKFHKLAPLSRHDHPKPTPMVNPRYPDYPQGNSLALKIVHAGGKVEHYYTAIPATTILEKYPSHVLAKPEVFSRPWDSVLRPENVLKPGQKFFLVPRHTAKKLRLRVGKPCREFSASFVSQASISDASIKMATEYETGIVASDVSGSFGSSFKKKSGITKHVTFEGIEVKQKTRSSGSNSTYYGQKKGDVVEETPRKGSSKCRVGGGKKRPPKAITWQPSLTSINEAHGEY